MNTSQLLLVSSLGLGVNLFGMFAMGGHHHHVRHLYRLDLNYAEISLRVGIRIRMVILTLKPTVIHILKTPLPCLPFTLTTFILILTRIHIPQKTCCQAPSHTHALIRKRLPIHIRMMSAAIMIKKSTIPTKM